MHKLPPLLIWLLAGMLVGAFVNRYSSGTLVERIGMTLLTVASCVITLAAVNFLRTRRRAPNSSAPTQTESVTETPLNILLFAIIPPFLVILDRWFDNPTAAELLKPAWCKVDWLCRLALPPYFVLVFVCVLVVFALVWTDVPNWMSKMIQGQDQELPDADLTIVPSSLRRRRPILRISALVGIVFLIARQVIFGRFPGWEYAILCFLYLSSWAVPHMSMAKIINICRQKNSTATLDLCRSSRRHLR